ncbi:unnamed protein product [Mytilus coruscus]|uniref:Uncharacterized protein n=1 Tax=Mytilus coruscus TaxID=42192 RepID=A0A6J8BB44_MYTCO|nr:unnamed protein product [Mytilus coruscus]
MKLRPSEIFFSQDSISNKWGEQTPCRLKLIGETLDELLTKSISLEDIPNITAVIKSGKFYTVDNRRLWVFRKAEELGFVNAIEVNQVTQRHVRRAKFTTNNGGISIRIRGSGDPGGTIWRTWKPNTLQEVNEKTVSKSALRARGSYANESRTNVNQYSFFNKANTEAQHPSTYKSSYSDYNSAKPGVRCADTFSSNCESLVFDKENQLKGKYFLESTLDKTSKRVQGPVVNQSRTNYYQYSFFNKTDTEAQHPRTYKSSYSDSNSAKADVWCDDTFSSNCESPVSDKGIQHSNAKRSTADEEENLRGKSSFESTLDKNSSRFQGPAVNQRRKNVFPYAFFTTTDTEAEHPSSYQSSYSKYNSAKPNVWCDNAFSSNCESPLTDKEKQNTSIQRSTAKEKPTFKSKSSFESTLDKTSTRFQGPAVNQRRTNVYPYSIFNKTDTEAEHPCTYKSSDSKYNSAKPDVLCENAFSIKSESPVSDIEIQCSSINRSKVKEEPSLRSKSSFESTSDKTSSRVQGPVVNQSRPIINQYSLSNKTDTEAEHPCTYKSSYSKYNSAKPDVLCENAFSINSVSPVSDKEMQSSSKQRSTANEKPTLKSKYFSESTSNKTSLPVQGPVVNQIRTSVNPYSFFNKTDTEVQDPSTYKSSYSHYNSAKPDVRCDNAFSGNCDSPVSEKEIQHSSTKRSTAKEKATLRSKSYFESTLDKTSNRVQGPVGNQSTTNVNQYSFFNKTDTEAQHPTTYTSSYSNKNSAKHDDLCDNAFSGYCESLVSAKQIQRSRTKKSTAEEEPNLRSKLSLESNIRKNSLPVQGPAVNQSRTNVDHHSFLNKTNTEAHHPSRYKSSYINCNSAKPDVRCDNDFSINSESIVSDKEMQNSRKQRSTAKEKPTLKSKSSFESTLEKNSSRVQGPVVNQSRKNVSQYSSVNKTNTEAEHSSSYKSSYSHYNSAKPDVRCDNTFSVYCESPVSYKEIQHSSTKRSTAKEKPTLKRKSPFESTLDKTSSRVNGPAVNKKSTAVYPYSFFNKTDTEVEHLRTYKSSYSKYNSAKPDVLCENAFSIKSESPVSDIEIQCSSINRSKVKEEPTLRSKSSFESTTDKTSSRVQGPVVNQSRPNINQYSLSNKTDTEAEHPCTYKSSYSKYSSAKTDVLCENAFSINSESPASDKEMQNSSKQRSTAKEKPTIKSKSSFKSTLEKNSSRVQGPVVNQSRKNVSQYSSVNKTNTEAEHPSSHKSSYSHYNSAKPDVRLSYKEIQHSSTKRSTAKEKPTLKSKSPFDSTLDKTSTRVRRPVCYQSRTDVNQESVGNKTVTKAQHPSTYTSSYMDYISAKPDVRCDNDFVGNCEYPLSAMEIQRSSIKRSTAEKRQH